MKNNSNNFYWGILHCHIQADICHWKDIFDKEILARAKSQIDSLHEFVRDEMKYDFLSYADHHNMGKMIELGNADNSPWKIVLDAWDRYNSQEEFITILGYEYQDGQGEYNVYLNRSDIRPDGSNIHELIASVDEGAKGIILAAHNRPNPTDWKFEYHNNFRLVEIINEGGNAFEEWALAGLEAGHRVGFIGGSDDHSCTPGRNSSTCVLTSDLSRQSIWEALEDRRTVATSGIRPEILFTLNDKFMGSEITCNGVRSISVQHRFEKCPQWVGIIKNGKLLEQFIPEDKDFSFTCKDSKAERDVDYYYLKIIYPDGNCAFASPIWVTGDKTAKQTIVESSSSTETKAIIPEYKLKMEFGERIGRSMWFNAEGLYSGNKLGFSKSFRDMVCHLGPDPLLVLSDNRIVYPTMDAMVCSNIKGTEQEILYTFTPEDDSLALTSLCEIGETIQASGYLNGTPVSKTLKGPKIDIFDKINPLEQFFYKSELISPSWLASDGGFFCILCEREGIIFTRKGIPVGCFQDNYPAFPVSVKIRSLDEIYVLDFEGTLSRYSFAAATTGKLLWKNNLGKPALSLCLTKDGVLVYNNGTKTHYEEAVTVQKILDDGSSAGSFALDLKKRLGTSLAEMEDGVLAAMHNSSDKVAAIHRSVINETGTIRIFEP